MNKIFIAFLFSNLSFLQCSYIFEPVIEEVSPVKIFEDAWQVADENYPFFTFKNIDWDVIYQKYYLKAKNTQGDEILIVLHNMLGELKDGHIWFYTNGGKRIKPFYSPRTLKDRKAFSLLVVQKYFDKKLSFAGGKRFFYGILSNNIGYIYISTFKNDRTEWYIDFKNIISRLKNTDGIIIDVRNNEGGSDIVTHYVISFFLQQPIKSPVWVDSQGNKSPEYWINPNKRIKYLKNIVVLQNGTSFSAAEEFVNIMKELPSVTTVGDTTAGGSGAPEDFRIDGGFIIHIPTKALLRYNGEYFENTGISPDI
ncbi:hypothetical protein DRQ09_04510, partial [candidate division KSB1 bacterium]